MTDRELLEAASVGLTVEGYHDEAGLYVRCPIEGGRYWNPLTDKGDAVSLLLKLKLRVDYVGDQPCIDGVLQHGMTAEQSFCRGVTRAAAAMARGQR
jgi:hypothetical protein